MDARLLVDGLIMFLGLVILLTFHEFGHAWVAWKCGDDTARFQGRVSLNPLVHIDPIGTAYFKFARYGFLILIVVLQVPVVRSVLGFATMKSQLIIAGWFGMPVDV
jgi:Zn-dependent protease